MDFEGAKKYGTEDTGKLLDMMSERFCQNGSGFHEGERDQV